MTGQCSCGCGCQGGCYRDDHIADAGKMVGDLNPSNLTGLTSIGQQVAQCVDDMAFTVLALALGDEEKREERREQYYAAKARLTMLIDGVLDDGK
jgi:hypothetical protein